MRTTVSKLFCLLFLTCTSGIASAQNSTPINSTPPPVAPAPAPKPAPTSITASTTTPATRTTPASAPGTAAAPAGTPAPAPRPKAPAAKPAEVTPPPYTGPIWKKQVTRDIEMGEKVDTSVHRLRNASPDNTLLEMFAIGIKTGKISSFYTSDFSMATRIKNSDFDKLFIGRPDTIAVRDATGKYVPKIVRKSFNYSDVHKYRVMEEWTSYPGIGKTEIQIVGIAPLRDIFGDDGAPHGVDPIFWVHYTEDIKLLIARYDQYHPNNTLGGRIWGDYFGGQK